MSKREITPVAAELIAAKKRIEDPENWWSCGDTPQGSVDGGYCAMLALLGHSPTEANHDAYDLLSTISQEHWGAWPWHVNDTQGHAAVMQMYDHAIQRALNEGK